MSDGLEVPAGGVPLAAAVGALRDELVRAWWDGHNRTLRFKPSAVDLTLQVGVTSTGGVHGGVKWWLIELGGEASREGSATQTVRIALEPVMLDEQTGEPLEFLIDAPGEPDGSRRGEQSLEGDG